MTLVDALSWIHKNIGGIIGKVADLANKAPTIGGFFGAVKSSLGLVIQKHQQKHSQQQYHTEQELHHKLEELIQRVLFLNQT